MSDEAYMKLRRENDRLKRTLNDYRKQHQEDIAEITFLRRLLECVVEANERGSKPSGTTGT